MIFHCLPPRIHVVGYFYLVDFVPTTQPRFHTVDKKRRYSCELSEGCPAIETAADYLCNGGKHTLEPMPVCPVCGVETVRDRYCNSKYQTAQLSLHGR